MVTRRIRPNAFNSGFFDRRNGLDGPSMRQGKPHGIQQKGLTCSVCSAENIQTRSELHRQMPKHTQIFNYDFSQHFPSRLKSKESLQQSKSFAMCNHRFNFGSATYFSLKYLSHISIMSGPHTHFSPYRLLHSTRTVEFRLIFSKSLINRTHNG